jgi:hypothetical protein
VEPILKAPKFDGTPFIITSDGCKDRFGAVLSQRFTIQLPSGDTVIRIHLVGFTLKCTSPAEEWYKPYLLEDEINLKKRQLFLKEFKAGILEVEEYWTKLQELNNNTAVEVETLSVKRAQYSPDWDEIK